MRLLSIGGDEVGALPSGLGFGKLPFASGLAPFADVAMVASAAETAAALELVSFLAQSGKRIVLAIEGLTPELRAQAFGAGAIDVFSGAYPDGVVAAVLRTRLRTVEPRLFVPVQAGAKLFGPAGAVQALLTDVSAQGFHARIEQEIPAGAIVRVQPAGSELPALFARIHESASGSALAMWTGLFPDERERLAWYLGTLGELDEGEQRLLRIAELRCDHLLVRGSVIGGPPLPPLTDVEREALQSADREANPLSWIALARMRSAALAAALVDPAVPRDTSIEGATHREIVAAESMAREAAAAALAQGSAERNRLLSEVHKRVAQAVEALERVAQPTDDTTRRQPLVTAEGSAAVFAPAASSGGAPAAAPAPAASGSARTITSARLRLAALGMLATVIIGITAWRIAAGGPRASDAAKAVSARRAVETVQGVRVEKVYEIEGGVVGVVDGTWFQAGDEAKEAALRGLAKKYGAGKRFAFRDAIGREVAWITTSGQGFFVPDPDTAYKTR